MYMKVLYTHTKIKHRWMTSLGVQISSEKKMRKLIGENLAREATPFTFQLNMESISFQLHMSIFLTLLQRFLNI